PQVDCFSSNLTVAMLKIKAICEYGCCKCGNLRHFASKRGEPPLFPEGSRELDKGSRRGYLLKRMELIFTGDGKRWLKW
ncbi:hypothetical protein, partial [Victivallis vadensis]|uniref:hypothetical protein n=1 Tax=Victivallis vadensis TaxID=172901 RepID=UPI003AF8FC94